jgi:type I restriction enzyme, S subunit
MHKLPSDWHETTVDHVCEMVSVGIVVQPAKYYTHASNGVRAFRSQNVGEGYIKDRGWVYLTPEGHKKNSKSKLQEGDVLVVRTGAPGTACVVPKEYAGANCIDLVIARPKPESICSDFLAYVTNSDFGRNQVQNGVGGLAQQHFNVSSYKKLRLRLPPRPEQRHITNILRTWDDAIENVERLLAKKEKHRLGLSSQFMEGCVPSSNSSDPNWDTFKLGDLFDEREERGTTDETLLAITGKRGVVDRDEIERRDTSNEDKSKYKLICPGDIGYNTMRMWQGVCGLSKLRGIVSPAYTIATPRSHLITGEFAEVLFKLPRMVHEFRRYSQGLVDDTLSLKFPQFAAIKIVLPKVDRQVRIATTLRHYQNEIDVLKRQISAFERQKRGLMQKLLTGEWRVPVRDSDVDAMAARVAEEAAQ